MSGGDLPPDWRDWGVARLEAALREHNHRYWDLHAPVVSDYAYDRLVERVRELAPTSPVLDEMGPTAEQLGNPVEHAHEMLSLDKAYDEEALQKWAAKFEGELVMTPKIDGVACSIRYDGGALMVAATRGSGRVGEDITANVLRIANVPNTISITGPVEVRGEVYLPWSAFHALEGDFANPRNTAAGGLKQKDPDKAARMGLRFFVYDVIGPDIPTEIAKFETAASWGFDPVEHRLLSRDDVQRGYESYVARRADLDFEIDGVVYKANRLDEQARLGATAHHPRYAIAYKLQGESATTHLREVIWSVSRTGALTPVGIVDPVVLSGATVTRISLHNWGLVQSKGLTLNAQVVAMRRGGVIPYLEAVVRPGDGEIRPPETCPACDAPARVDGDFVVCTNADGCVAKAIGVLGHFAKVADIEGFGQVWLETLYEAGLLRTPADFYALTAADLVQFDRMGEVLAGKLVANVDAKRTLPLATFLQALGAPGLGQTASRTLARALRTLAVVRAAEPLDLVALPKFGDLLAAGVVEGIADRAELIDALLAHVTVPDEPELRAEAEATGPLAGKSFLFTGTLASMKRADAQARVVALGGTNASGVSKSLSYLVVGSQGTAGSKLAKAEKAAVEILPEDVFAALLEQAEAEDTPEHGEPEQLGLV